MASMEAFTVDALVTIADHMLLIISSHAGMPMEEKIMQ